MRTTRLRITLVAVDPPVWRLLDLPARSTLPEAHQLLQAAMGWTDSHLHEFDTTALADQPDPYWTTSTATGVRYGRPDDELEPPPGMPTTRAETGVALSVLGSRWVYRYDFGDGWTHDVVVLGRGADRPGCVDGAGACPPEDCGGPGGYAELRATLADPTDAEHAEMARWAGIDPGQQLPEFDQQATDRLVRQMAGAVPPAVRLLLELAAEGGLRLTPGGRLPRHVVRRVQDAHPDWAWAMPTPGAAHREEDLIPLCALHDLLRAVGLLQLRHGALHPIKAAADDQQVLRRLRDHFDEDGFTGMLAGDAVAALAVAGPRTPDQLATTLHPLLGRWVHRDGTALSMADVRGELHRLGATLQALDQISIPDRPGGPSGPWRPGEHARWLLPRATALAALWNTTRYPGPC